MSGTDNGSGVSGASCPRASEPKDRFAAGRRCVAEPRCVGWLVGEAEDELSMFREQ